MSHQSASMWAHRADGADRDAWLEHYWQTRHDPQRVANLHAVFDPTKPESVLDVGCNTGPNLAILRAWWPSAPLMGIDVNEAACRWAFEHVDDLSVVCGDLRDVLPRLPDGAFDAALSQFTLAYVQPNEIGDVMRHLKRVARRLVIIEPREPRLDGPFRHWAHDYAAY